MMSGKYVLKANGIYSQKLVARQTAYINPVVIRSLVTLGMTIIILFVFLGNDPLFAAISDVKNKPIANEESLSIDDVFDDYKYFKDGKWTEFETNQRKPIVQFSATYTGDGIIASICEENNISGKIPSILVKAMNNLSQRATFFATFMPKANPLALADCLMQVAWDKPQFAPTTAPFSIFKGQQPLPFSLFLNKMYYNYNFIKCVLTNNFNRNTKYYSSIEVDYKSGIRIPVSIEIDNFHFDDKEHKIIANSVITLYNKPMIIRNDNGVYTINNQSISEQQYIDIKAYKMIDGTKENWFDSNEILQTINLKLYTYISDRMNPIKFDGSLGTSNNIRMLINLSTIEPFSLGGTFTATHLDYYEFSPTTKQLFKEIKNKGINIIATVEASNATRSNYTIGQTTKLNSKDIPLVVATYSNGDGDDISFFVFNPDGSGEFRGHDVHSAIEWSIYGNNLKIIYFDDDETSFQIEGKLISKNSFLINDSKYDLIPNTVPVKYDFSDDLFTGSLLLHNKYPDSDSISIKIETLNHERGSTCELTANCEKKDNKLVCHAEDTEGAEESNGVITITGYPSAELNLDSTYSVMDFCGIGAYFAGKYKKDK